MESLSKTENDKLYADEEYSGVGEITENCSEKKNSSTTSIMEKSDGDIQNDVAKNPNDISFSNCETEDYVNSIKSSCRQAGDTSSQELNENVIVFSKESVEDIALTNEANFYEKALNNSHFADIYLNSGQKTVKENEGSSQPLPDNGKKSVVNDISKENCEDILMDEMNDNPPAMNISHDADSSDLKFIEWSPPSRNVDKVKPDCNSFLHDQPQTCSNDGMSTTNPAGPEQEQNSHVDCVEVQIKEEPIDPGYERSRPSRAFGCIRPIVVYSDTSSDSDDTSSGSYSSESDDEGIGAITTIADNDNKESSEESEEVVINCRTKGEMLLGDLPIIEDLTVAPDEKVEMEPLGKVTGIVDILVVIKANPLTPALYDDTVLFSESRQPLGLVFETFGTVEQTYYSMRFNRNEDIINKGIQIGDVICFAPKADNLTKYVFLKELQRMKFDDASWEHDNEPPISARAFSDDEEEKQVKKKRKNRNRRSRTDGSDGPGGKRTARRRKNKNENSNSNDGPVLLQGDLNRNPFGYHCQPSRPPPQWQFANAGSNPPGTGMPPPAQPPPPSVNMFNWPPHNFGGPPRWQMRPGFSNQGPRQEIMHRPFFQNQGPMSPPMFGPMPPPMFQQQHFPPRNFNPDPQNNTFAPNQFHINGESPWLRAPVFNTSVPPPNFGQNCMPPPPPPPH